MNSLRVSPTWSELFSASSMFLRSCARARSTSSFVGGLVATPSMVWRSVSRAASSESPCRTSAPKMASVGSRHWKLKPKAELAFFVSTSALCSRPAGVSPSTCETMSRAAKSGCAPEGTW